MTVMSPEGVAAIGATVTALVGVLVGRKTANGRVDKSEAAQLWKESSAIRRELQEQIRQLREEINSKDLRIAHLEDKLRERDREVLELQAKVVRLQGDLAELKKGSVA